MLEDHPLPIRLPIQILFLVASVIQSTVIVAGTLSIVYRPFRYQTWLLSTMLLFSAAAYPITLSTLDTNWRLLATVIDAVLATWVAQVMHDMLTE
ncbi:Uncharacterized protein PBTT_06238 [Plasmodiophora brassicae]